QVGARVLAVGADEAQDAGVVAGDHVGVAGVAVGVADDRAVGGDRGVAGVVATDVDAGAAENHVGASRAAGRTGAVLERAPVEADGGQRGGEPVGPLPDGHREDAGLPGAVHGD